MKKTITQEDMERINALYVETQNQSVLLKEILTCLKGEESMGIEGVIPAQKRMQLEVEQTGRFFRKELATMKEEFKEEMSKMDLTIQQIDKWKSMITIYLGLVTSSKIWRFIAVTIAVVAIIVLSIKYGFLNIWQYIKNIVL